MTDEKPKLTKAQEVFIDEYLLCFNATAAYKKAHPSAKDTTAASNGWKLLRKTEIQDAIKERLNEVHMSADEALKLTADIARGDITEFLTPFGNLDIDLLRKSGKGRLVRKIKQKTVTKIGKGEKDEDVEILETELELYDAQGAIRDVLKVHGKFVEKHAITDAEGNTIDTKETDARFERAISTLADALREVVPAKGNGEKSEVDTAK